MNWRSILSTAVEVLGLVALVFGVALVYFPAAIMLGGLCGVLIGVALDPPAPRKGPSQ